MKDYFAVIERCPQTGLFVGFVPGFSAHILKGRHSMNSTVNFGTSSLCCSKTSNLVLSWNLLESKMSLLHRYERRPRSEAG
jgi:hypothetical protein